MRNEIVIETPRLRLRTWTEHYGALLNEHCNTDEVMKHLGGKQSAAEHGEMVRWLIEDQQEHFGITFWVMERKANDEFLGFCGLVKVDETDSTVLGATELGYRVRADRQGQGYAKEAAIACLHYAFRDLKELRVVSRTFVDNGGSWGLMKALGMRHDPRLDYLPIGEDEPLIVHVADYKKDWLRIRKLSITSAAKPI